MLSERRRYQITGVTRTNGTLFSHAELLTLIQHVQDTTDTEAPSPDMPQKKLIECTRVLYYSHDLTDTLPVGEIASHGLPYQSYSAVFTPAQVARTYGARVTPSLLADEAGYLLQDGLWWKPSGRMIFDEQQFYQPIRYLDALGNVFQIAYDHYALLVEHIIDPLQNQRTVLNDYRTMRPMQLTDANGNCSQVRFDALGTVVATAHMGRHGQDEGDTLTDPTSAIEYDLFRWMEQRRPNVLRRSARYAHGTMNSGWQERYSYLDGSGHEMMQKCQAEPYDDPANARREDDAAPQLRWLATRCPLRNQDNAPIKTYAPYFSATADYEDEHSHGEPEDGSMSSYDALGRLIRSEHANETSTSNMFAA